MEGCSRQILVLGLLHERKDLGNDYRYDDVDKAMKHDFVWYAGLHDDYEKQYRIDDAGETSNNVSTPVYISYNWQSGELIAKQLCSALDKATITYSDIHHVKLTAKQKDLVNFCSVPRSSREILERVGVSYHSKNIQNYITSLIEAGYLEMTNPENPKANNQKYRKK